MKHKTGDDRVVLKKKLQDLEREWEEVCQVSVERQDRLEQAYKQIGQFRSHVIPLRSWMTKVLPMLDESEPVHGDIDTTDALMTAHSVSLSAHHHGNDPFSHLIHPSLPPFLLSSFPTFLPPFLPPFHSLSLSFPFSFFLSPIFYQGRKDVYSHVFFHIREQYSLFHRLHCAHKAML